jgi:hypothetical protein
VLADPVAHRVLAGAGHGHRRRVPIWLGGAQQRGVQRQHGDAAGGIAERRLPQLPRSGLPVGSGRQEFLAGAGDQGNRVAAPARLSSALPRALRAATEVVVDGDHQPLPLGLVQPVQHRPVALGSRGTAGLTLGRHLRPAGPEHRGRHAAGLSPRPRVGVGAGCVAHQQPHPTLGLCGGLIEHLGDRARVAPVAGADHQNRPRQGHPPPTPWHSARKSASSAPWELPPAPQNKSVTVSVIAPPPPRG